MIKNETRSTPAPAYEYNQNGIGNVYVVPKAWAETGWGKRRIRRKRKKAERIFFIIAST
jgi:hypothetical protein